MKNRKWNAFMKAYTGPITMPLYARLNGPIIGMATLKLTSNGVVVIHAEANRVDPEWTGVKECLSELVISGESDSDTREDWNILADHVRAEKLRVNPSPIDGVKWGKNVELNKTKEFPRIKSIDEMMREAFSTILQVSGGRVTVTPLNLNGMIETLTGIARVHGWMSPQLIECVEDFDAIIMREFNKLTQPHALDLVLPGSSELNDVEIDVCAKFYGQYFRQMPDRVQQVLCWVRKESWRIAKDVLEEGSYQLGNQLPAARLVGLASFSTSGLHSNPYGLDEATRNELGRRFKVREREQQSRIFSSDNPSPEMQHFWSVCSNLTGNLLAIGNEYGWTSLEFKQHVAKVDKLTIEEAQKVPGHDLGRYFLIGEKQLTAVDIAIGRAQYGEKFNTLNYRVQQVLIFLLNGTARPGPVLGRDELKIVDKRDAEYIKAHAAFLGMNDGSIDVALGLVEPPRNATDDPPSDCIA